MSLAAIRAALETTLAGMSPPLATAWENARFEPPDGNTPYQAAYLLPGTPDNREIGPQYLAIGLFDVLLFYPLDAGPAAATARAEAIQATFYRGLSITSGGIIVTITRTPDIRPARREDNRWLVTVRIAYRAPVNT